MKFVDRPLHIVCQHLGDHGALIRRARGVANLRSVVEFETGNRIQRLSGVCAENIHERHRVGVDIEQVNFFRQGDAVGILGYSLRDVGIGRANRGAADTESYCGTGGRLSERRGYRSKVFDSTPQYGGRTLFLVQSSGSGAIEKRQHLTGRTQKSTDIYVIDFSGEV